MVAERGASEMLWRKSAHSGTDSCVEVAWAGSNARVRNSRNAAGGQLAFPQSVWEGFLRFIADR
ncbi:hypothetical protein GCM10010492_19290 [Saccharothrix mutabilis subsp. mutabilis]|uniref:DUF397 domain-containing protein n=2 Tax=Saccharothrix mutabilis TaxID=33921 RepID=A0ABN0TGV4_9PSEU